MGLGQGKVGHRGELDRVKWPLLVLFTSLYNHFWLSSLSHVFWGKVKNQPTKTYICINFEGAVLTFKSMRVYDYKICWPFDFNNDEIKILKRKKEHFAWVIISDVSGILTIANQQCNRVNDDLILEYSSSIHQPWGVSALLKWSAYRILVFKGQAKTDTPVSYRASENILSLQC